MQTPEYPKCENVPKLPFDRSTQFLVPKNPINIDKIDIKWFDLVTKFDDAIINLADSLIEAFPELNKYRKNIYDMRNNAVMSISAAYNEIWEEVLLNDKLESAKTIDVIDSLDEGVSQVIADIDELLIKNELLFQEAFHSLSDVEFSMFVSQTLREMIYCESTISGQLLLLADRLGEYLNDFYKGFEDEYDKILQDLRNY